MKSVLAGALAVLAFAGAAQAAQVEASLKTPLTQTRRVIVGNAVWDCKQSACQAVATDTDTPSWQACRTLVRRVGPVASYAALTPEELAKCNGEEKK